jgi:hypothetical protein
MSMHVQYCDDPDPVVARCLERLRQAFGQGNA